MGDCQQFADRIAELNEDRHRLELVAARNAKVARDRFSERRCAEAYAQIFQQVMSVPPPEVAAAMALYDCSAVICALSTAEKPGCPILLMAAGPTFWAVMDLAPCSNEAGVGIR